ncbi:uncharacterized protein LOC127247415 [Andrographis paniculata]|uniref:uncharacterized protein LOC127247415 n=1 Tax=Andrographis paniculata TaxID=175694 RepID=UPI0021E75FEA|nr:uncharacterized protein LOC127247415 [Andrographis paniculata]
MSIAKSAILKLCNSFSSNNGGAINVSGVCFSTAFRQSEGSTEGMKEKASAAAATAADKTKQGVNQIKGTAEEMADVTKQYARDVKEMAEDSAQTAAENTKNAAGMVAETGKGAAEKVRITVHHMKQKASEIAGNEEDAGVDKFVEDHIRQPVREHRKNS